MISICIPAHNEERTVGLLLWKIRKVMSDFGRDYRILLLDDASTDRTATVVEPYRRVIPLEIFSHEQRKGHGASLEELLREVVSRCEYPRRDVIVTMQADFTEAPEDIPALVKRIEGGADLVVAARAGNGETASRTARWIRKGLPWLERRYDLPEDISDPTSGLRAYRVSVIKRALAEKNGAPLLTHDGWAGSLELLAATAPHARRIEETEAQAAQDRRQRRSRMSIWKATREFIGMLRK